MPRLDGDSNGSEDKSADHGTDDANNNVANEAMIARSHDLPGKPSSRQTDRGEPDDVHVQTALVALELRTGFPYGLFQFVPSDQGAVPQAFPCRTSRFGDFATFLASSRLLGLQVCHGLTPLGEGGFLEGHALGPHLVLTMALDEQKRVSKSKTGRAYPGMRGLPSLRQFGSLLTVLPHWAGGRGVGAVRRRKSHPCRVRWFVTLRDSPPVWTTQVSDAQRERVGREI